jgi:hypothetical protein
LAYPDAVIAESQRGLTKATVGESVAIEAMRGSSLIRESCLTATVSPRRTHGSCQPSTDSRPFIRSLGMPDMVEDR